MEYTNDFGLRDSSDSESEEARPESPASESGAGSAPKPGLESDAGSSPDSARCRCSEQRGRCIHCRLEQFRAEQVRASAQAAAVAQDPHVSYAEAAARQLEAQIAALDGHSGLAEGAAATLEAHSPSSAVSVSTGSVRPPVDDDDDGLMPSWLMEMIHNPVEESGAMSGRESPQSRGRGRGASRGQQRPGATTRSVSGRARGGAARNTQNVASSAPYGGGAVASRTGKQMVQRQQPRRGSQRGARAKRADRSQPPIQQRPMTMEEIYAQEMANAQSPESGGDGNNSSPTRSPRSKPSSPLPSARELGFADESLERSLGPPSPLSVHHPRPWSPPSTGRSLHSAPKPPELRGAEGADRERRRQAATLTHAQAIKKKARSKVDTGRHNSSSAGRGGLGRDNVGDLPAGGSAAATALTDMAAEVARLRRENHALRSGDVSAEVLRLRKQVESLRAEMAEQKGLFRSQLSRARQRSKVLEEQIVALHAEKRAGWVGAPSSYRPVTTTTPAAVGRHSYTSAAVSQAEDAKGEHDRERDSGERTTTTSQSQSQSPTRSVEFAIPERPTAPASRAA